MTAYELKNIAILNVKGDDLRCILWGISRDEAVNKLNNSVLEDQKYYCSSYVNVNQYGVKCGKSLRIWKNIGWINEIDPYR